MSAQRVPRALIGECAGNLGGTAGNIPPVPCVDGRFLFENLQRGHGGLGMDGDHHSFRCAPAGNWRGVCWTN